MFIFRNREDRNVVKEVDITLEELETAHDGDFISIFHEYDVNVHIPVWID